MSLSCKVGAYNQVIQELLKLDIPLGNIFMLYGPIDLLCLFEFDDLEEFKAKWFNPVRLIGSQEEWITRTNTFIVIQTGRETMEEPFAFLFLNTQPQSLMEVQRSLLQIPEVLTADSVFGPYDVICSVKAEDRIDLERIVSQIHENIQGIIGSVTAVTAVFRM